MDDFVSLGIDPASTKIAVVALVGDEFKTDFYKRLGKSGGESCAGAWHAIQYFVSQIHFTWPGLPIYAYIEAPVVGRAGVRSTMVQAFTSGAIQAALYEAGCSPQTVNVSSWKKSVIGRGNATKEEAAKWLRLRRPALHRSAGGNQDIVDAACIAIYGQQLRCEGLVPVRPLQGEDG